MSGTLNLNVVNGFSPAIGNTFQVITFASRTGQFTTVNGLVIGNGNQFSPAYSATNLTLNVVAAFAPPALTWSIVSPATPPVGDPGSALRISSFAQTPSGAEFQFQTVPGARYRLEGTEDLTHWTPLLDNLDGTGHLYQFLDPAIFTERQYFYRFRLLP